MVSKNLTNTVKNRRWKANFWRRYKNSKCNLPFIFFIFSFKLSKFAGEWWLLRKVGSSLSRVGTISTWDVPEPITTGSYVLILLYHWHYSKQPIGEKKGKKKEPKPFACSIASHSTCEANLFFGFQQIKARRKLMYCCRIQFGCFHKI